MSEPETDPEAESLRRSLRRGFWSSGPPPAHWLTRFVFLRGLGLVYLVAFLVAANQQAGLIGPDGILPTEWMLQDVASAHDSRWGAFWETPTLFWVSASDAFMQVAAWLGVALSLALLLGYANVPIVLLLWILQLSFVHAGQLFWGYGWELMLIEVGFLAVFVVPPLDPRPLRAESPPPAPVVWLLRWLVFRVMFGAGLIKLRGDPCWTELTCLEFHYETQPIPNPLSRYLHAMPDWAHAGGVLFNHFVELVAPWGVFGPRRVRHVAGAFIVAFQIGLIVSGNLSFLNWLTIVAAIACFDDSLLRRLLPRRLRALADARHEEDRELTLARRIATWSFVVLVAILSIDPIVNMLSPRQAMNRAFDPFHLVNTYGAFGSITRTRYEVVLEGTRDETIDEDTEWKAYELPCKPGDPNRAPCVITPYHYRLDWQMWFLPLRGRRVQPWMGRLCWELLEGNDRVEALFSRVPFPDDPPRHLRASFYEYEFAPSGEPGWWRRTRIGDYVVPVSRDGPRLREFLRREGWLERSLGER